MINNVQIPSIYNLRSPYPDDRKKVVKELDDDVSDDSDIEQEPTIEPFLEKIWSENPVL